MDVTRQILEEKRSQKLPGQLQKTRYDRAMTRRKARLEGKEIKLATDMDVTRQTLEEKRSQKLPRQPRNTMLSNGDRLRTMSGTT